MRTDYPQLIFIYCTVKKLQNSWIMGVSQEM